MIFGIALARNRVDRTRHRERAVFHHQRRHRDAVIHVSGDDAAAGRDHEAVPQGELAHQRPLELAEIGLAVRREDLGG